MANPLKSLSSWQQTQKCLFESPEGGITSWSINKIEDFEKGETVLYPTFYARVVKRMVAAAMPVFAFFDATQFLGQALFRAVVLQPDEALDHLSRCAHSIKLLITSFFVIPVAVVMPSSVYRKAYVWEEIADQQNQQIVLKLFEERLKGVDRKDEMVCNRSLIEAINETCGPLIFSEEGKVAFENTVGKMKLPLRVFEEQEVSGPSPLVKDYVQLFSKIAIKFGKKNYTIPENLREDFVDIAQKISELRRPELRLKLIDLLMKSFEEDQGVFKRWKAAKDTGHLVVHAHLPFFSAHHVVDDSNLLKGIRDICINNVLKDKMKRDILLQFFVDLSTAPLSQDAKKGFLQILQHTYSTGKNPKDKITRILEIIKILNILITLQNPEIVDVCLQNKEANSNKIQEILFEKVFDIKFTEAQLTNLLNMRAPWAFIFFHLRLKELSGEEWEKAVHASKECLQWVADGKYQQEWHNEAHNPHLKKIFNTYPDLKAEWIAGATMKVQNLVSDPYKEYSDFDITDSHDPSDALIFGTECSNCLNLHGRVHKVKGLLGFIRDGKTHKIMAKDKQGRIWAETGLQLMWDKTLERPVLFLESISCNIEGKAKGGQTLPKALIAYAEKRAEQLGLDLVGHFVKEDETWEYGRIQSASQSSYSGEVCSLGSSSPMEYVNLYFGTKSGPYSVGAPTLMKKAYRERVTSLQYDGQTWKLKPIEDKSLCKESGTSKQYKATLSNNAQSFTVRVKESSSLNEALVFHQMNSKKDALQNFVPEFIAVLDREGKQLDLDALLEKHPIEDLRNMELYKPVYIVMKDLLHGWGEGKTVEGTAKDFKFVRPLLLQEPKRISRPHGLKERSSTHRFLKRTYFNLSDCSFAFQDSRRQKGFQVVVSNIQNVFNIRNTKETLAEEFSRLEPPQLEVLKGKLTLLEGSFRSSNYVFFDSSLFFIPTRKEEGEKVIRDVEIRLIDLDAGWSQEGLNEKDSRKHQKVKNEMAESVIELQDMVIDLIQKKQASVVVG